MLTQVDADALIKNIAENVIDMFIAKYDTNIIWKINGSALNISIYPVYRLINAGKNRHVPSTDFQN